LLALLKARDQRDARRHPDYASIVFEAVAETVQKQVRSGIDVIGDGEMGKAGFSTYVTERLTDFDGESRPGLPFTDCGFSTFARSALRVHPTVTWAKLQALAEGARLASQQLF
jgi:methionine synthase II (cobalamin-independent)